MQSVDFSYLKGFPSGQKTFKWMQDGALQIANALVSMGWDKTTAPLIISGCEIDGSLISAGWMYWQGELMYFLGGNIVVGGQFITVLETRGAAKFADNSNKEVYITKQVKLTTVAGANPDVTNGSIKRYQEVFGALTEYNDYNTIAVPAVYGASGNINYRINHLAQTLHVQGSITITNAQSIASPPIYSVMGTVAAPFMPANTVPFVCSVRYHSAGYILEANGTEHLTSINAELDNAGSFNFGFIRPDVAVTSYTIMFNTHLPLL